jgi:hypothetical protein
LINNIAKNINSYIFNQKEELNPKFKLNSLFNAIAKRNGYTSWSHLKITNKNTQKLFEFVDLFSSKEDIFEFLNQNIDGLNTKACEAIYSFIPFKKNYQFPYTKEVCEYYELSVVDLGQEDSTINTSFTLYSSGDSSVGLPDYYAHIYFDSKEQLEEFISANIKEIRNTYLNDDFEVFQKIFTTKECSYIVNYYNDEGRDLDEEFNTFESAVVFLENQMSIYHEEGSSFGSLMATPTLSHPSGDGREWDLEKNAWI